MLSWFSSFGHGLELRHKRGDLCRSFDGACKVHRFERIGLFIIEFVADYVASFEITPFMLAPSVCFERIAHHLRQCLRTTTPLDSRGWAADVE